MSFVWFLCWFVSSYDSFLQVRKSNEETFFLVKGKGTSGFPISNDYAYVG